jgi:alpha-D-ribose 1-methylphosphonate 5-triphosphate diphosphatase
MAEAGVCTVLTSDYYYPAMARAAFILVERGRFDLARAWSLIAANPAQAAALSDRGAIEPGRRADIVIAEPNTGRILATLVAGRIAHLTATASDRLRGLMP